MAQEPLSQIGKVIDRRREEAGLNLRDLADKSGIPLTTLHRWLAGGRGITAVAIGSIANALGIPASELIAEAEQVAA